jgi:hypothetical protein
MAMASHFPQWAKDRFNPILGLMKEYLDTVFSKSLMLAVPFAFEY